MFESFKNTHKKLVATASRREDVYNRTDRPSVTCCEGGGTVQQVTDFLHKKSEQAKLVPTWSG